MNFLSRIRITISDQPGNAAALFLFQMIWFPAIADSGSEFHFQKRNSVTQQNRYDGYDDFIQQIFFQKCLRHKSAAIYKHIFSCPLPAVSESLVIGLFASKI